MRKPATSTDTPGENPAEPPAAKPCPPPKPAAKVPEIGGPPGPEPTRYGDWEIGGRAVDF